VLRGYAAASVISLLACSDDSAPRQEPFREIIINTAPGLSGLAVDQLGALWAIAERQRYAYRIRLSDVAAIEAFPVVGVPTDVDLEGIAVLAPNKLALAAEGRLERFAAVVLADFDGRTVKVTDHIELPDFRLGLEVKPNNGAEGICNVGAALFVAIETSSTVRGRRWTPIVRVDNRAITQVHRLWLTTSAGKLSTLDCRRVGDQIQAIAIERHFNETKILTFTIPDGDDEIVPRVALDLGPVLRNRLNLEGIAWLHDGSVIAVNDNQWKVITGPSELLVFTRLSSW